MSETHLIEKPAVKNNIEKAICELREIGSMFHARGWCLGTSGNFSAVVARDPLLIVVTASGKDKSVLSESDFVVVDGNGKAVTKGDETAITGGAKPSAEALLHATAARVTGAGAVLHTHSIWSTILSDWMFEKGHVEISGFEMLKGLEGITTHDTTIRLPIFENTQSIPDLAKLVEDKLKDPVEPMRHAYLIKRHGMHTWGADLATAKRHVEILEFLYEAVARLHGGKQAWL
jgi:methylthioribulose-1-phosphate dehydratase